MRLIKFQNSKTIYKFKIFYFFMQTKTKACNTNITNIKNYAKLQRHKNITVTNTIKSYDNKHKKNGNNTYKLNNYHNNSSGYLASGSPGNRPNFALTQPVFICIGRQTIVGFAVLC